MKPGRTESETAQVGWLERKEGAYDTWTEKTQQPSGGGGLMEAAEDVSTGQITPRGPSALQPTPPPPRFLKEPLG